jgi:hypothetical protein
MMEVVRAAVGKAHPTGLGTSGQTPYGVTTNMRNKANRRKCQVAPPPSGVIPAEGGWATLRLIRCAKQSQFALPGGRRARPTLRSGGGPAMRNKAKSGRTGTSGENHVAPPAIPVAKPSVRNKANSGGSDYAVSNCHQKTYGRTKRTVHA